MLSWLAKQLLRYNMTRLNAGDIRPTLWLEAEDITLHFPGRSSWSGTFRGKSQVRPWLERFARVGIQIFADPLNTKALINGSNTLGAAIRRHLDRLKPGDYFALLAYLPMFPAYERVLQEMRAAVLLWEQHLSKLFKLA